MSIQAELTRWQQQPEQERSSKPVITLRVSSQEEMAAAQAMVQAMYQRRLPDGLSQQQLTTMLRLADMYDVGVCAAACAEALSKQELEPDTVMQVLHLSSAYADAPASSSLFDKAADQLQQEFGDLELAWTDEQAQERFLALPLKGVELLLGDNRTRVAYENTALVAATAWVQQHSDRSSQQGKDQVAQLIRCPFLTPFFAFGVAMATPWFVEALGASVVAAGLGIAQAISSGCDAPTLEVVLDGSASLGWPASWGEGRRPLSARSKLALGWRVPLEELEALYTASQDIESPTAFFGGYDWCMSIGCSQSGTTGRHRVLHVYMEPRVAAAMALPSAAKAAVMVLSGSVRCKTLVGKFSNTDPPIGAYASGGYGFEDFWCTGPLTQWDPDCCAQWSDSSGQMLIKLKISAIM